MMAEAVTLAQEGKREADGKAEVAEGEEPAGLGVEVASAYAHGWVSFSTSVVEAVPGEEGHLDGDKSESDCEQVPAPDVVDEKAVLEQYNGQTGDGDAGNAGGTAAVLKKALVDEAAEERDLAENGMGHGWHSNWKI